MAEFGNQTGKTRDRAAPVTPAPTRSQVNRESKAPRADPATKPPPNAAGPAAPLPPEPAQPAGEQEPQYGRRRADQPENPVTSSGVERPREEVCEAGAGQESESARMPPHRWHVTVAAAQIALALISVMTEPAVHERGDESDAMIPLQAEPEPQAGTPQVLSAPSTQTAVAKDRPATDADAAMNTALDDLDAALETRSDRSPEELLREASAPDHDCMLAWHDHLPSLIFGQEPIGANSLADALHACANAVRRLR